MHFTIDKKLFGIADRSPLKAKLPVSSTSMNVLLK